MRIMMILVLLIMVFAASSCARIRVNGSDEVTGGKVQAHCDRCEVQFREAPPVLGPDPRPGYSSGRFEVSSPKELARCQEIWLSPSDTGSLQRRVDSFLVFASNPEECAQWLLWASAGSSESVVGGQLRDLVLGLALFPSRDPRSKRILELLASSEELDRPAGSEWLKLFSEENLSTSPIE